MKQYLHAIFLIIFLTFNHDIFNQNAHDYDLSFGNNGIVVTNINGSHEYVYALALQSDGKIVSIGNINGTDLVAVRYNTNGSVDSTFGTSGYQTILVNSTVSGRLDGKVQPDGKILIAGRYRTGSNNDFGIFRLNADGSIDNSFGTSGAQITDIGDVQDAPWAIALQTDGKIIVAGQISTGAPSTTNAAMVRYNANGTLDTSFGTNGIVIHDISSGQEDYIVDLALRSDGKIVAAAVSYYTTTDADYTAVQYNTDGTIDNSFGVNGIATADYNSRPNNCAALALQPDGKIVLTGNHSSTTSFDYMTVRLNANGSIDNSFGTSGIVISQFGSTSQNERGADIEVLQSGKIIVAGEYRDWANVVRYNSDGTLDSSFGTGGNQTLDVPSGSIDKGRALLIQPDGKILIGGNTVVSTNNDFMLIRLMGDAITGINTFQSSKIASVFPNPSSSQINVVLHKEDFLIKTISLIDLNGRVIDYFYTLDNKINIDVNNLSSGIYFLNILSEAYSDSFRFVKE